MRFLRLIGVVGLVSLWLLCWGCEQKPPAKPPAPVVKKIKKPPPKAASQERKAAEAPKTKKPAKTEAKKKPAAKQIAKADTPKAKASAPTVKTTQAAPSNAAYFYDPGGRPDPFRPFYLEDGVPDDIVPICKAPPGPLTDLEATQFSLVAVLSRGRDALAMVQDASGKGYMIRLGTYVGKKCGRVTYIGDDGVVVEEPYKDALNRKKTRKVTLGFKASEGGGA